MESEKKGTNIWELIGKLGAVVGLVWVAIQIYSFFDKNDFVADVHGEQLFYKAAPSFVKSYKNIKKFDALLESALQQTNTLKDSEIIKFALKNLFKDTVADSLVKNYKKIIAKNKWANPYEFESNLHKADDYESKYNYNSMWLFTIKNNGSNPFDELSLELPVNGCYEILFPNTPSKFGLFNKRIALGNLNPTYQYQIYVWSNEDEFSLKDHEANSKFTYKNGFFTISYSAIATGFFAWLINVWNLYEFPLLFSIFAILMVISIVMTSVNITTIKPENIPENKPKIRKTRQPKLKQKDSDEKID